MKLTEVAELAKNASIAETLLEWKERLREREDLETNVYRLLWRPLPHNVYHTQVAEVPEDADILSPYVTAVRAHGVAAVAGYALSTDVKDPSSLSRRVRRKYGYLKNDRYSDRKDVIAHGTLFYVAFWNSFSDPEYASIDPPTRMYCGPEFNEGDIHRDKGTLGRTLSNGDWGDMETDISRLEDPFYKTFYGSQIFQRPGGDGITLINQLLDVPLAQPSFLRVPSGLPGPYRVLSSKLTGEEQPGELADPVNEALAAHLETVPFITRAPSAHRV